MSDYHGPVRTLTDIDLFSDLTEAEQAALAARLAARIVHRGEVLMAQGEAVESLYVVLSGRFSVTVIGREGAVSELGPGQPAGEIAFLTGGLRTATVTAMRDSLVLELSRPEFDHLVADHPGILMSLTAVLARRLSATTSLAPQAAPTVPVPRTICIVAAGGSAMSETFVERLSMAFAASGRSAVLTAQSARTLLGTDTFETPEAIRGLNGLEASHDHVLLVADTDLSPWTEKAIRNADLVLAIAHHDAPTQPNDVERFAARFVAPEATRLVLLHPTLRKVRGTAAWLAPRAVAMHHHVALDGMADVERLVRFISGRALGFVAAGGGALAAAHTGLYKALCESGIAFDMMGGTSAGAALAAAFILNRSPDDIDRLIGEMFVANRALRRFTLPRYALLDHTVFDGELKRLYGETDIEDLWLPFFAVSTNLSRFGLVCHRSGPVWRAIRASASIPALLPPVYTAEGDMLVDGCILDNVPIRVMHGLKAGPNVVVSFKVPEIGGLDVDYDALPSRTALIRMMLNPMRRHRLPAAPGLIAVLMRALMANRRDHESALGADDISLMPPIPADLGFLDWHRHGEVFQSAYHWACLEIEQLAASAGCPPWLAAARVTASRGLAYGKRPHIREEAEAGNIGP